MPHPTQRAVTKLNKDALRYVFSLATQFLHFSGFFSLPAPGSLVLSDLASAKRRGVVVGDFLSTSLLPRDSAFCLLSCAAVTDSVVRQKFPGFRSFRLGSEKRLSSMFTWVPGQD